VVSGGGLTLDPSVAAGPHGVGFLDGPSEAGGRRRAQSFVNHVTGSRRNNACGDPGQCRGRKVHGRGLDARWSFRIDRLRPRFSTPRWSKLSLSFLMKRRGASDGDCEEQIK